MVSLHKLTCHRFSPNCVRLRYVVANAVTVIMMTLFIPYEALVEVSILRPLIGYPATS